MRLNIDIKAYCMCAMFGILVPSSNVAASSVQILIDAALDQSSLRTANEVVLQVARAAGQQNSVGLVVFDEVFQRSTDLAVADDAHIERISRVLSNVTSSEFSNIAVGIEKGISELNADGGVLLVFGNSDILLADAEAVAKYSDWLEFVVLPDAASKSIAIILAVPQNAPPSALNPIIQGFSDNKVISFSDTYDATDQLSLILPFTLPGDTQASPVAVLSDQPFEDRSVLLSEQPQEVVVSVFESPAALQQPIPEEVDLTVAGLPASRVVVTQEDKMGFQIPILLTILALLVLAGGVVIMLMLKRRGTSKHAVADEKVVPVAKEPLSRYLAPKQGNTIVRPARPREADSDATLLMPQTDASQGFSDSTPLDEPINAGSSGSASQYVESELDVTAPREPVKNNAKAQVDVADATMPRIAIPSEDSLVSCETGVIDELEELRSITLLKHETQS